MSRQDLASAVKVRRQQLKIRNASALQERGGPSPAVLTKIENASADAIHRNTFAKLDDALEWAPGSAEALLATGAPPTDASDTFVDLTIPRGSDAVLLAIEALSQRIDALARQTERLAQGQEALVELARRNPR